jgi:UDP-glucuronate 4-epimerase
MKVFLTGAAGFIGFHTAQALLARGDEVVGFDAVTPYYDPTLKEARLALLAQQPGFQFVRGNLLDREAVGSAMQGADRVCHLAAIAGVRYSFEHPEEYIHTNLTGFFHVIDEARLQHVPGFIYASSSSVYGANDTFPSREDHPTERPLAIYGMTKKSNELHAYAYHRLYGLPTTGLRFFTVYGPYGRPDMSLFQFTEAVLQGKVVHLNNNGQIKRDFTYVDDIVAGVVAAIDLNAPCEVFNLACGRQEQLTDYLRLVEESCGRTVEREFRPMQPGDFAASSADISKARQMLGYEPKTTITAGVPRFVAWYRSYYGV